MAFRLSSADHQEIVQIAYHVPDLDEAIAGWHSATGLGPFLVRRHIQLSEVRYRGASSNLDISAAFVQSGDIQVELIQQHCGSASAFRDMFTENEVGLHHVAIAPSDRGAMLDHYRQLGFDIATEFHAAGGGGAAYVDARRALGHMVEIYEVSDRIRRLYDQVAASAADWDRRQLIVEL